MIFDIEKRKIYVIVFLTTLVVVLGYTLVESHEKILSLKTNCSIQAQSKQNEYMANLSNERLNYQNRVKFVTSPFTYYQELKKALTVYYVKEINMIRLGKDGDGGYVSPVEPLQNADLLFGYGIDVDASFEEDFVAKFGKKVYAFDCGNDKWPSNNPKITFIKECVGTKPGNSQVWHRSSSGFNPNLDGTEIFDSFNNHLKKFNALGKKIALKIDIEGGEYDSIEYIDKKTIPFIETIIVELHHLDKLEYQKKALSLLKFLNKNFTIVHAHAQNPAPVVSFNEKRIDFSKLLPSMIELTFVNNKYTKKGKKVNKHNYSEKLDRPCESTYLEQDFAFGSNNINL